MLQFFSIFVLNPNLIVYACIFFEPYQASVNHSSLIKFANTIVSIYDRESKSQSQSLTV